MKKILVADDERMILKAVQFKLQHEGYEVLTAEDGKTAKSLFDEKKPDLVITDLMMPSMNGLELISSIKSSPMKDVPIIVLSAVGQEEKVLQAFRLGASDFVNKPFSPHELAIRVAKLLPK